MLGPRDERLWFRLHRNKLDLLPRLHRWLFAKRVLQSRRQWWIRLLPSRRNLRWLWIYYTSANYISAIFACGSHRGCWKKIRYCWCEACFGSLHCDSHALRSINYTQCGYVWRPEPSESLYLGNITEWIVTVVDYGGGFIFIKSFFIINMRYCCLVLRNQWNPFLSLVCLNEAVATCT